MILHWNNKRFPIFDYDIILIYELQLELYTGNFLILHGHRLTFFFY